MFRRRRRGDALGRPVFKRRWVVLDSNNLIVYDGINLESGVPTRRKDSVSLNGIEWTLERNIKATKDLAWCFALAHSHQDSIYFAFEDEHQMMVWMLALEDVLLKRDPNAFDVNSSHNHYKTLDLVDFISDDLNTLQVNDLRHAYRHTERKLRTADTEDGKSAMDVLMSFHRAKTAYYSLYTQHFSNMSERRKAKLKYTATIKKKEIFDGGSSMGFSLVESPETGRVMVHSVSPNLLLISSEEDLEPYDEISTINGEVVSAWPISRVAQYLSAFRIPNGTFVDIEFTRREIPDNEDIDAPYLLAHSLDEGPAVYHYLHSCREFAMSADTNEGGEVDEDDVGKSVKNDRPSSFRASITNLFASRESQRKPERATEDDDFEDDHEAYDSMNAASAGRGSPKEKERPSSMSSPRFSLFGGGSAKAGGNKGSVEDGGLDDEGSPDRGQASSSGRFFSMSGKRNSEAAAENSVLQAQIELLKEEVEILTSKVDDFTLQELRLQDEAREKTRKIAMLEENEQLLHDQIADLSAEVHAFKSGAKHAVSVAKVPGLSIDEKVTRLRQRYGISE